MAHEDESRLIGVCAKCGSMYAALEFPNGSIRPIGSRDGCTSCGATEFVPLSDVPGESDAVAANDSEAVAADDSEAVAADEIGSAAETDPD